MSGARYEQCWVYRTSDGTAETSSAELSKWGADGWRVVAVVSRPGMVERVLMERELPPLPKAPRTSTKGRTPK